MSSESSVSSNSSRIRQFGLYRTIDARTEEFLRLSRKRQIRQGCACAIVSTAITVTVVVVILLIYEYAIAVEWSIVQRRRGVNDTNGLNITNDSPYADRLDRSYFGFDQDYFERMPLLVNALQESNYVDPSVEISRPISKKPVGKSLTTTSKTIYPTRQSIRRTSPRPFYFEYRGATPLPFSKTYGSRSWVDSYRNSQRLQNIRQVIKYLEKTINAKSADMNTKPETHASIAFSGVYVEPTLDKTNSKEEEEPDNVQQSSDKVETYHINHQEDPLYRFKPDSPGEVNLLAETMLRFSPIPTPSILDDTLAKVPIFKKIPSYNNQCTGNWCKDNIEKTILNLLQSSTEHTTESAPTTKSFSVMLNLFPLKSNITKEPPKRYDIKRRPSIDKIYLTTSKPVLPTSKPLLHFRKKTIPSRRTYYRYKKPRYLIRKEDRGKDSTVTENTTPIPSIMKSTTPLIVHVNVYSPEEKTTEAMKNENIVETTTKQMEPVAYPPINEIPVLTAGQVEDHHDGSSGILYINPITEAPPIPTPSQITPFFEVVSSSSEENKWVTSPPEYVKFNAEDAKVPEHYVNMDSSQYDQMPNHYMNFETTTRMPDHYMSMETTEHARLPDRYWNMESSEEKPRIHDHYMNSETSTRMLDHYMGMETTEQAMMPDHYMNSETTIRMPDQYTGMETTEQTMANQYMNMETTNYAQVTNNYMNTETTQASTQMTRRFSFENSEEEFKEPLVIKLRNNVRQETTTPTPTTVFEETTIVKGETTTAQTYVPQINGHYRSFHRSNNTVVATRPNKRRRLEMKVTGFKTYVPMYIELKRNYTRENDESKDHNEIKNDSSEDKTDYDENDDESSNDDVDNE